MLGLPSPLIANLFACAGVAYLYASWLSTELAALVLKPIPVLILVALVLLRGRRGGPARLIALGLAASAVGDVLLAWSPDAFTAGLVAFLVAHLLYLVAFLMQERRPALALLLPVSLCTAGVYALLHPHLKELLLPVTVYVGVITAMLWRAGALRGRVAGGGAALLGAALFVLSDSLLAINKFAHALAFADVAVMLTYWAGQLWIARSVLASAK